MKRHSPEYDLSTAAWHKSSYSGGDGADCLEVAPNFPGPLVPVRDSKAPLGPKLVFRAEAWSAFVTDVKNSSAE
ncbi:DUF397 domain-containing protein [Streptomyces sp. NPDC087263]|uniref:DUF397 domain-containing protein n=1 Tax=Streptomyces sp. NPDC087263 TaxID=3365773 RepID=UPI00381CB88B